MDDRILLIDDDPKILNDFRRALHQDYNLVCARGMRAGLESLAKNGPFALVVADMDLKDLDGIRFLDRVRRVSPNTVCMLTTGCTDLETALDAVNRGGVFRLVKKPCPAEKFSRFLEEGLGHYRSIMAERRLLADTLRGNIKMLTDIVAASSPQAAARTERIRRLVRTLGERVLPDRIWFLDLSALLSQIGYLNVSKEVIEKYLAGSTMTESEKSDFRGHPEFARGLLTNIPRLEKVALILAYQEKHFDGTGIPEDERAGTDIPIESRILKICSEYDRLLSQDFEHAIALACMKDRKGVYDPAILAELERLEEGGNRYEIRRVDVGGLVDGGILTDDVETSGGTVLCRRGVKVDRLLRTRLVNHAKNQEISGKIKVALPVGEPQGNEMLKNVPHMLLLRGDRKSHYTR